MRHYDGAFTQEIAASTWEFTVPDNYKFIEIIGAYSADGNIKYRTDNEDANLTDGKIHVDFGIDQYAGVLKFSYEIEGENDQVVVNGDGGNISITVNQYNNKPSEL